MITACTIPWLCRYFAWIAQRKLRRQFAGIYIYQLSQLEQALQQGPVMLLVNHVGYWDAVVAMWLSHQLAANAYGWMAAKTLQQWPMFRALGGFAVDSSTPHQLACSLRYAASLLQQPRDLLWVFPQGCYRYQRQMPLQCRRGSQQLAAMCAPKVLCVPMGLSYVFGEDAKASVFVHVGTALPVGLPIAHEQMLAATLQYQDRLLRSWPALPLGYQGFLLSKPTSDLGWGARLLSKAVVWQAATLPSAAQSVVNTMTASAQKDAS